MCVNVHVECTLLHGSVVIIVCLSVCLCTSFQHTVNNIQSITAELWGKQEDRAASEELAPMKEELNLELTKHDARMQKAR